MRDRSSRPNAASGAARPLIIGVLIAIIQVAIVGVCIHFRDLGLHEPPSDSEFGNWHLEAQLFWISTLVVVSLILIYIALRDLLVPFAGVLVIPVLAIEFTLGTYIASKLHGPDGLRAAVLAGILPIEFLMLPSALSLAALLARAPVPMLDSDGGVPHPQAPSRRFADLRIAASAGIGVQVGFVQLILVIYFEFWGVYEPPSNLLHLRLDNQLTWFAGLIGGPSIVLVYLALRRLRIRYAAWLVLPTVIVQFEVCALIATQMNSLGHFPLLCAGVLPAELIGLAIGFGVRPIVHNEGLTP